MKTISKIYIIFMMILMFFSNANAQSFRENPPVPTILQGGWSIDCESPPVSWRIFSEDKAIGPLSQVSGVLYTEVYKNTYTVYFDDGYSDEFRILNNNSIEYLYQYNSNGGIYRDWTKNGGVVLSKCSTYNYIHQSVPLFLQGDWSVDCGRPPDRHRIFTEGKALGPGSNILNVTRIEQHGPVFTVYFDDGTGEAFLVFSNDSVKYLFQFSLNGVTRNWSSVSAIINRCDRQKSGSGAPQVSMLPSSKEHQQNSSPSNGSAGISKAILKLSHEQAIQKTMLCSAKYGLKKLTDSAIGKTVVDVSVDFLVTGNMVSLTEFSNKVMKTYALMEIKNKLKSDGHDGTATAIEIGKFVMCVYEQKTL